MLKREFYIAGGVLAVVAVVLLMTLLVPGLSSGSPLHIALAEGSPTTYKLTEMKTGDVVTLALVGSDGSISPVQFDVAGGDGTGAAALPGVARDYWYVLQSTYSTSSTQLATDAATARNGDLNTSTAEWQQSIPLQVQTAWIEIEADNISPPTYTGVVVVVREKPTHFTDGCVRHCWAPIDDDDDLFTAVEINGVEYYYMQWWFNSYGWDSDSSSYTGSQWLGYYWPAAIQE